MELIVILLCSMSGALIGTAIGILLMFRKIRQPTTEAELAVVKGKLQSAEGSLAKNTAYLENLRNQIAERGQAIQRNEEALREKQQQLDAAVADRAASEQRARELSIQAEDLTGQCTQLAAKVKEERDLGAAMLSQHISSYETQLTDEKQQLDKVTEQVASLTAEAAEARACCEQEKFYRSSLETQLGAELEHVSQLTAQVQELQSERSLFDLKLQEERQSASKGMELLLMAQENLARVFKSRSMEAPNGSNGHGLLEAVGEVVATEGEGVQELQLASSRD